MTWPTASVPPTEAAPEVEAVNRAETNGSQLPGPSRLPRSQPRRPGTRALGLAALLIAISAGGAAAYWMVGNPFASPRTDLLFHRVGYTRLDLTVVERGALESADNRDVVCKVKARNQNSTVCSTLKWVIDDGSHVKQGEKLVDLDDSGLQEQLKTQKITLDQARSAAIQAEENHKIVISQNLSEIETAKVNIELAKLNLEKFIEGDYLQQQKDIRGRIITTESDVEMWRDRVAWSERMVKKGYLSASQALSDRLKMEAADINLKRAQEELRVLEQYTKKLTETDLHNKLEEAKRALDRTEKQAKAKEVQADTDRLAKKSIAEQEQTRYEEIQDEIKKCVIFAPQDGMVVYFVPEQTRFGGGSQQAIVAQGEPVREGQKLMRIPNLNKMQVNTRVHEAMVSRVRSDQPAQVRVDAFPDRTLRAHVESVATVAAQQDFLSADVKVYQTIVAIDDAVEGLKPGMSAEVTITVGHPLESVLTLPLQAVVGSVELGKQRKCFVMTPDGPVERDIVVGVSNERLVEIRSGVQEGEQVILNPKALVGDKMKTRTSGATPEPTEPKAGERSKQPGAAEPNGEAPKAGPGDGKEGRPKSKRSSEGGSKKDGEGRSKQGGDFMEKFQKATPAERKGMLDRIPEQYRDGARQKLKAQGIEVAD